MSRKYLQLLLSGAVLLVFTNCLGAQSTPKQSLLVLSKHDHTLSIVDPATGKVVAHAPVGQDPHEVVASTDGKTAYVSIYGGGRFHVLNVIDLVEQKALPDIDLGALTGPHGLTFVGGKLWFTAEGAKAVGRYDPGTGKPSTGKIDWILGTGQNRTHMLYVTADEKQVYTTNVSSATVSILQNIALPPMGPPPGMGGGPEGPPPGGPPPGGPTRMDWNQTVVPVGPGDEGFDVSPDGRELWTANAQDGTVSVLDLNARKVTATLRTRIFGANRLKFTLDGKLVFVSSLRGEDLVILDARTHAESKRIKIGHGAAGILMQPDGGRAYVACGPDNYVAVIDMKKLEVAGHIEAGGEPDGLAWATQR